jgi:L-2-hydroxyglutarate oxidase LhgO
MKNFDFVIIGAGIMGLTLAYVLQKKEPSAKILIIEKESDIGFHASGRNSGVLHSGVYYGSDTLKAKFCAEGSRRMRQFAKSHKISCNKTGKIIIATSEEELKTLDRLIKNAQDNHINVEKLSAKELKLIEPFASPYKYGLYSPDTSVIDSPSVLNTLRRLLEKSGVHFIFNTHMSKADPFLSVIETNQGKFSYGYLYNAAGASADLIAKKFDLAQHYRLIPFKGIYYKLKPEKSYMVKSNIYPVPDINLPFLGIHLTRVVSGDVYLGPTAIPALGRENYVALQGLNFMETFSTSAYLAKMYFQNKENFRLLAHTEIKKYKKTNFFISVKKLVNNLKIEDLIPSNKIGIRPQLINLKTGTLEMDYIIEKGLNSTHILNSISPAFTCAFAFSEWIVNQNSLNE